MTTYLLDVNVLVALAWSNHVHHVQATRWFQGVGMAAWATCPITQARFVRISSNPAVIVPALSPARAVDTLRQLVSHPTHQFWPDGIPVAEALQGLNLAGHRQITDAYLAGLARHYNGKLATFDRGLVSMGSQVEILGQS